MNLGSENPHVVGIVLPAQKGFLELHGQIIGNFFFVTKTVAGEVYLHILEQSAFLHFHHLHPSIIFQHDGAAPLWNLHVR